MAKNSPSKPKDTMAGALLCPTCVVEYVEVMFDMEVDGTILHNVRAMKCPGCNEEVFTPEQHEEVRKRIRNQ